LPHILYGSSQRCGPSIHRKSAVATLLRRRPEFVRVGNPVLDGALPAVQQSNCVRTACGALDLTADGLRAGLPGASALGAGNCVLKLASAVSVLSVGDGSHLTQSSVP